MTNLTKAAPISFVLTRNRDALEPFHAGVLGLRQIARDDFGTVYGLGAGDATLRLTTVEDHVPTPHTVLGWAVPDIRASVQALAGQGVTCAIYPGFGQDDLGIWTAPGGFPRVCWFSDPEGNVLSLTDAG